MDPIFKLSKHQPFWTNNIEISYPETYGPTTIKNRTNKEKKHIVDKSFDKKHIVETYDNKTKLYKELGNCGFFSQDALRMANADAIDGITKYSGGYLAKIASFTYENGEGNPFYFAVSGNSGGGVLEYLHWRRIDSYGLILGKEIENIRFDDERARFYNLTSVDESYSNFVIRYVKESFIKIDLLVCDRVHDINYSFENNTEEDWNEIKENILIASEVLKDTGYFIIFMKKLDKDIIHHLSHMFEKILVYKNFTSSLYDNSVVVSCKNFIGDKTNIGFFTKIKEQKFISWYSKIEKEIMQQHSLFHINVPRVISSMGLFSLSGR